MKFPIQTGQVFISAHHDEYTAAENLEKALVNAGYTVWWAAKVTSGTDWHGNIDLALQSCDCVVVLWSQKSVSSGWVRHEASQAIARGIYVPVLLERVELKEPYSRNQATLVDGLLNSSSPAGIQNVVRHVQTLLPSRTQAALSRVWDARSQVAAFVFAALVVILYWKLSSGVEEQIARVDDFRRTSEESAAKQRKELAVVSANLADSNASVSQVIGQVRDILSSDLDFAFMLGTDRRNAGYLRVENVGSGIATVKSASITHDNRGMSDAGLLLEMERLGIRPFKVQQGQKISPGRGVALFGIPAEHVADNERCISDKARKEFFERLQISLAYTSPYSEKEQELVWKYKSTNTVRCLR